MSRWYDGACGSNGILPKATRNLAKHEVSFDEASTAVGKLGEVFIPQAVAGEGCWAGLRFWAPGAGSMQAGQLGVGRQGPDRGKIRIAYQNEGHVLSTSFVAIDIETANADLASICQIGVVTFAGGEVGDHWQSLIDPEDEFDGINVSIHGIAEATVRGAPRFCDVASHLAVLLANQVVVSHMAFDRVALSRAHEKYHIPAIPCRWLDTARVCRRTWTQFARRGYGLADVAAHCGIEFRHHDALEDARAAGLVLLRAISETSLNVEDWLTQSDQPIDPQGSRPTRAGNPDGELFGEVVVFTGALSMPRREAAAWAASAGCDVVGSVGETVTLLVVGDQDIRKLAGHQKSSKHRKAEEFIRKGQSIRILTERDFAGLVGLEA